MRCSPEPTDKRALHGTLSQEDEGFIPDVLPPDMQPGDAHKPYFEVLIVTPADPNTWERGRTAMKRLRRPEDSFNYEIVQVGSFEDGIRTVFNHNVQAVVIYDGFPFRSRHDLPLVRGVSAASPAH